MEADDQAKKASAKTAATASTAPAESTAPATKPEEEVAKVPPAPEELIEHTKLPTNAEEAAEEAARLAMAVADQAVRLSVVAEALREEAEADLELEHARKRAREARAAAFQAEEAAGLIHSEPEDKTMAAAVEAKQAAASAEVEAKGAETVAKEGSASGTDGSGAAKDADSAADKGADKA